MPSEAPVAAPAPPPPAPVPQLAYVAAGVGAAGLIVGTVFGLRAISKRSESNGYCDGATCSDPAGVEANDSAKTAAWVSDIGFGIGVVGVGLATYLVLAPRGPAPTQDKAASLRVNPVVGSGHATMLLEGTW